MDEKCLRTPVYTMETVFESSAEVPVDIDFNLPDYCPEISKILKCRAVARVASKTAGAAGITADGSITVTVIYADEGKSIYSYEYQYPFSKTFETGGDISGAVISAIAGCGYINCRAVTERKIDIHGAAFIKVSAACRKSHDVISDIDKEDIEVLRSSAPATMPVAENEKYLILEEELDIGNSQPDIRCLIRYDAAVSILDCKLLAGKAMIRGETAVNLLYRSEQDEIQTFDSKLPFSQLVELDGAGEECECNTEADISYLEIKPKFNSSGASRSFLLDGKICLKASAYCNNDVEVITDAYSRKYETDLKSEEVCFNKTVAIINDTFISKGEVVLGEEPISGIYDVWCDIKSVNTAFEGDCLIISGDLLVNLIADQSGEPVFFEKTVDYTYRYKIPAEGRNLRAKARAGVISAGYTISGERAAEIKPQIAISAEVFECKTVSLLSDIGTDQTKPLDRSGKPAMTVYFAKAGERLWDIARKYLADIQEVKRLGGIDGDIVSDDTTILLPLK